LGSEFGQAAGVEEKVGDKRRSGWMRLGHEAFGMALGAWMLTLAGRGVLASPEVFSSGDAGSVWALD